MNPNSPKSLLQAAALALAIVAALMVVPLAVGVNPWWVILPAAVIGFIIRAVDARHRASLERSRALLR